MLRSVLGLLLAASLAPPLAQKPLQEPLREYEHSSRGNPLTREFGDYVEGLLDRFKVPSLTIAVVDDGQIYSAGYGTAIFPDTKATPETLYCTASTTKSFTAAALTLLRDRSANTSHPLLLTDPVQKYLPVFRLASDYATLHTTIEDALSHRSGLPRHDFAYGSHNYSIDDLLEALPHLALTAEPRTTFQYCNIMFILLSRVIELVSGTALGDFFKQQLWVPFGMHSTYFSLADAQAAEKHDGKTLARGYYWDAEAKSYRAEPWLDVPLISGAGNIISNVLDYAAYLSAMLNRSKPISEQGYTDLRSPRTIITPRYPSPSYAGPLTYSLGWIQSIYHGEEVFAHDGGLPGFGTLMAYMPSKKWAVVMMGNTEERSNGIESILQQRLVDDLFGIPHEQREDLESILTLQLQVETVEYLNSTSRLFPDAPADPTPLSRPLAAYAATYWNPGYRNVTLALAAARFPGAGTNETALEAQLTDRAWALDLQLEHVSGEHFVAWGLLRDDLPTEVSKIAQCAEFRIAASGEVEALGIAVEDEMKGEKIWFTRRV